jgi:flavin-dependent dehydrogenase
MRVALDGAEVLSRYHQQRPAYCVRRSTLDPLLQEAAQAAGAELRDQHRVVDVVRDAERVSGVIAQTPNGPVRFEADLVVGADGPHSTIARLTGVEDYLVTDGSRGGYWGYYPAPARWDSEWDATLEHRGDDLRYVFRCDGDMVILVGVTDQAEAATWGRNYRDKLQHFLAQSPTTRALSEGKQPIGKGCGLIKTRFFYRRPVGPGFALVGDAGHFKDFVTGQGMTDALLDAERLAAAIQRGNEAAFEQFWRERDVATLPLHFDAIRQGRIGYNSAFMRSVFTHMHQHPELERRVPMVIDRQIAPGDLVPMRTMLSWMGSALLRGRFDVLRGFMTTGRQLAAEQKELAMRRALLAQSLGDRSRVAAAANGVRRDEPTGASIGHRWSSTTDS